MCEHLPGFYSSVNIYFIGYNYIVTLLAVSAQTISISCLLITLMTKLLLFVFEIMSFNIWQIIFSELW